MTAILSARPAWWQWPTVLSLDAPAVAVVWQALFAAALGVSLRPHHAWLLGIATWLVYVADRWFEGLAIDPTRVGTQRHRFYQRHRAGVAGLALAVAAAGALLAGTRLTRVEWGAGAGVALPVGLYLVAGLRRNRPARRLPKEAQVAVLFALGAACFPLLHAGSSGLRLAGPLVAFALLCFANLVLIARWERAVDAAHGQGSLPLERPALDPLWRATPWLIAAGAALAVPGAAARTAPALGCVAASALLLGALDLAEARIGRQRARALADFVLLTPLVPLCVAHLG